MFLVLPLLFTSLLLVHDLFGYFAARKPTQNRACNGRSRVVFLPFARSISSKSAYKST
jgi:hypothetical protein